VAIRPARCPRPGGHRGCVAGASGASAAQACRPEGAASPRRRLGAPLAGVAGQSAVGGLHSDWPGHAEAVRNHATGREIERQGRRVPTPERMCHWRAPTLAAVVLHRPAHDASRPDDSPNPLRLRLSECLARRPVLGRLCRTRSAGGAGAGKPWGARARSRGVCKKGLQKGDVCSPLLDPLRGRNRSQTPMRPRGTEPEPPTKGDSWGGLLGGAGSGIRTRTGCPIRF
jgi:hypothetical protein